MLPVAVLAMMLVPGEFKAADDSTMRPPPAQFQTSDRCMACHNGLVAPGGEDISIGLDWRASIMANSSRDPYWQASVRREALDHPQAIRKIEDECSDCHAPITRYEAQSHGKLGAVFEHLPVDRRSESSRKFIDGVTCSLCHQISSRKLGTPESFNAGFIIEPAVSGVHPEYGPYDIRGGRQRIMRSSSAGFEPTRGDHIRRSEMCATCHTLYTEALGADGTPIGRFPEQVPYQEWLHSDFRNEKSCQDCHMPRVHGDLLISRVLGERRPQLSRHSFVGANFFMQRMLNRYRGELDVIAEPAELSRAADYTSQYLQNEAARVEIDRVTRAAGRLQVEVRVVNLGGHKLPTAYPSRRAWLHFVVRDGAQRTIFESGALHRDGSIEGNDNDTDAGRFEPHYREIKDNSEVQIYEPILRDQKGAVTTGLLSAVGYLKDNRLLPRGFDKRTADPDTAVIGEAMQDPGFAGGAHHVLYSIDIGAARIPVQVLVELWYQPIGYRWANNLKRYDAPEPRRFTGYFDSMSESASALLARAEAVAF
jgi:hypothetical protein